MDEFKGVHQLLIERKQKYDRRAVLCIIQIVIAITALIYILGG